jgi:magnesium-transporting ATPase (P-type)
MTYGERQYIAFQIFKYIFMNINSVVVRCLESNKLLILSKGAEESIFSIVKTGNIQQTKNILSEFSQKGWRTLVLAFKEIDNKEYELFRQEMSNAMNDINNREELLKAAYKGIEQEMNMLGTTAVEDRLQDDVAYTLESLRMAGIKIWVLTGDNRETAINISNSCKHFSEEMEKLYLTDVATIDEARKCMRGHYKRINDSPDHKQFAYIIDGKTLKQVFNYELESHFRNLCMKCDAVLCCRMSPAQKAQVCKLGMI